MLVELIRTQKQIIQETFGTLNLLTDPIEPDVVERLVGIAALERETAQIAADFAVTFQQELIERGLEHEIYKVQSIETAATLMSDAVVLLEQFDPKAAGQPEQEALAALLKALSDLEHMVGDGSSSSQQEQEELRQALEVARKKTAEQAREREEQRQEELNEEKEKLESLRERQHELNREMAEQAQQSDSEQSESSESESPSDSESQQGSLSEQQGQLASETQGAASELSETAKGDPSLSPRAPARTQEAAEKMSEAAEQLEKQNASKALEEGLEAEKRLDEALEQVERAKERGLARQLEQLARDIELAARVQEEVARQTAEAAPGSNELDTAAAQQDDLNTLTDELAEEARDLVPRVTQENASAGEKAAEAAAQLSSGEIQDAMTEAAEKMTAEGGAAAGSSQEAALEGLREAADAAREALQAMTQTDKEKLLDAIATAQEALKQQRNLNREAQSAATDPTTSDATKAGTARALAPTQEETAELVERVTEQLDQLAQSDEYQPDTRDFREAQREADTATKQLESGNLNSATSSGELVSERLTKGIEALQKLYGEALLDDLAEAVRAAEQLEADQARVQDETRAMNEGDSSDSQRAQTALRQEWVKDDAASLAERVESLIDQSETAAPDARERLEQAHETLESSDLNTALDQSKGAIENDRPDDATEKQTKAANLIEQTKDDLSRAYQLLTTSELERLWESAEALGKLSESLKQQSDETPSDEQMDEISEQLAEESEKLGDSGSMQNAAKKLEAAAKALEGGEAKTSEPAETDSEKIAYATEQVEAALGDVVQRIDVLAAARRILLPKDETCPPEYEALVERYYRVLSEF